MALLVLVVGGLIARFIVVLAAFWIGAALAGLPLSFGQLVGAAVAITVAHAALTFEVNINLDERRSRW